MKNKKLLFLFLLFFSPLLFGWGGTGHRIMNNKAVSFFPNQMQQHFLFWADSLSRHASNADIRRSSDPTEGPKHYINIDNFPSFVSTGRINQNYDSLVAIHGSAFVIQQGILPWAILIAVDSLTNQFRRRDWQKAMLTAADVGHYVSDGHMPLHLARNYDGQFTGQNGIHSRYETQMINQFSHLISFTTDSVNFVTNRSDFVFDFIYKNFRYVDSLLRADITARTTAGNTSSGLYYQTLWNLTKDFTTKLFNDASKSTAALIYTAWMNAGAPLITKINDADLEPNYFHLFQNYPNPFNSTTKISYQIPITSYVSLNVYDILGNKISTLVNEEKLSGIYETEFTNLNSPSGVYFYRLIVNGKALTKKMQHLK